MLIGPCGAFWRVFAVFCYSFTVLWRRALWWLLGGFLVKRITKKFIHIPHYSKRPYFIQTVNKLVCFYMRIIFYLTFG